MPKVIRSRTIGTGSYLPKRVVTNEEISQLTEMTVAGILRRTGIKERRWVSDGESSSTLATSAAQAALEAARVRPIDLDGIVVSTTSPDMGMASTACLVQHNLGLHRIPAFDVAASCSGFLYALSVADNYIRSGNGRTFLVIGAEVKSRFLNLRDPSTAILFGDGAGAVVLQATEEEDQGLLSIQLHADGSRWPLIHLPGGGSRRPLTLEGLSEGLYTLTMKGGPLYRVATRILKKAVSEVLARHRLKIQNVDHLLLHQANARMIKRLATDMKIPSQKCITTIDRYGNTSSSSIPIALDTAVREGKIRPGDLILSAAFGGGLTWGTALIRW
ncbi:MAG: ketoacyl-ACP synthase III [Nitrospira sp.]|nr:ketoacyl-ACP synthase III [Nitrospira sp.]